jgi:hypothetical protein
VNISLRNTPSIICVVVSMSLLMCQMEQILKFGSKKDQKTLRKNPLIWYHPSFSVAVRIHFLKTNKKQFNLLSTNLKKNRRVSLLVDNRSNQESNLHRAVAVTVFGNARELALDEKAPFLLHHLIKHPSLVEFTDSPNCALILVEVEKYYVVQQFKVVTELYPNSYSAPNF